MNSAIIKIKIVLDVKDKAESVSVSPLIYIEKKLQSIGFIRDKNESVLTLLYNGTTQTENIDKECAVLREYVNKLKQDISAHNIPYDDIKISAGIKCGEEERSF